MRVLPIVLCAFCALTIGGCKGSEAPNPPNETVTATPPAATAATPASPDLAKPEAGKEITTPSGLKYTDLKVGSGDAVKGGDTVSVHYVGTFTDGKKFDASRDHGTPFDFQVGAQMVIKGWDEGLLGMKPGGKRKLVVPSDLAYGPEGRAGIPPNSTLVFEIELLEIRK